MTADQLFEFSAISPIQKLNIQETYFAETVREIRLLSTADSCQTRRSQLLDSIGSQLAALVQISNLQRLHPHFFTHLFQVWLQARTNYLQNFLCWLFSYRSQAGEHVLTVLSCWLLSLCRPGKASQYGVTQGKGKAKSAPIICCKQR